MKKFNLKKAMAGATVVTQSGQRVSHLFVCTSPASCSPPVPFLVLDRVSISPSRGRVNYKGAPCDDDLFMAEKKHKYIKNVAWININTVHNTVKMYITKGSALAAIKEQDARCVITKKIKWKKKVLNPLYTSL